MITFMTEYFVKPNYTSTFELDLRTIGAYGSTFIKYGCTSYALFKNLNEPQKYLIVHSWIDEVSFSHAQVLGAQTSFDFQERSRAWINSVNNIESDDVAKALDKVGHNYRLLSTYGDQFKHYNTTGKQAFIKKKLNKKEILELIQKLPNIYSSKIVLFIDKLMNTNLSTLDEEETALLTSYILINTKLYDNAHKIKTLKIKVNYFVFDEIQDLVIQARSLNKHSKEYEKLIIDIVSWIYGRSDDWIVKVKYSLEPINLVPALFVVYNIVLLALMTYSLIVLNNKSGINLLEIILNSFCVIYLICISSGWIYFSIKDNEQKLTAKSLKWILALIFVAIMVSFNFAIQGSIGNWIRAAVIIFLSAGGMFVYLENRIGEDYFDRYIAEKERTRKENNKNCSAG